MVSLPGNKKRRVDRWWVVVSGPVVRLEVGGDLVRLPVTYRAGGGRYCTG